MTHVKPLHVSGEAHFIGETAVFDKVTDVLLALLLGASVFALIYLLLYLPKIVIYLTTVLKGF